MYESIRSCQGGGTISFVHDASMCQCCVHTNLFYTIFRPALAKLNKLNNCSSSSDDYVMCGILTFLEGCLRFGIITDDDKSDISSNENPPDYTPLLDSIVNAKKKFSSRAPYSASIRALLYKYKKKSINFNETKHSVPKQDFDDCLEESTSALSCEDDKTSIKINERKRRVPKRHFDKCIKNPSPALLNKRKGKALKTNKTKQSTSKRHFDKCCKDSTSTSPCNHKKKILKTNKTKRSVKKSGFNDSLKDTVSTAGKKRSKAPKPKPKKKVADKIPTKGTLKRKRWFVKQMETEENYEDDIFENSPIYRLAKFDEVSQSSSDYSKRGGTPTWDFKLSPRPESPLPDFSDCGNIAELKMCRKEAEEYQHRRKKRRQNCSKTEPQSTSNEVKEEDRDALLAQPSCSYAQVIPPLKDEDCNSEELHNTHSNSEEEYDCCPNS